MLIYEYELFLTAAGHSLFGGMPGGYGHPLSSAYSAMMGAGARSGAASGYPGPHSVPTTSSYGSLGTLSVAASQAASLGINPASECSFLVIFL